MMRTRTPKGLKILLFVTIIAAFILISSLCLYLFEKDNQPNAFGSIGSAMQYVLITLTTVGYGDATPLTFGGIVITILTALIGTLVGIAFWIWIVFSIVFRIFFRNKEGGHSPKLEMRGKFEKQIRN